MEDFKRWLEEVTTSEYLLFAKRLSANDTGLTGGHQVGFYLPKAVGFKIFPSFPEVNEGNPKRQFHASIVSHNYDKVVQATWWNQKTRDEIHVTQWGGKACPLQDDDATGSLVIFAFHLADIAKDTDACRIWLCRNSAEEDFFEQQYGEVEPGRPSVFDEDIIEAHVEAEKRSSCWLDPDEIPDLWLTSFPTGQEIVEKAATLQRYDKLAPDKRILKRRDCEYELFRSVEHAVLMPELTKGFSNVDEFLTLAQSTLQRRKARSGRSLELHIAKVFQEEGLKEGRHFSTGSVSENGKKPDFLFPSEGKYHDAAYPADRLRMLGAKTTVKDRWRQVADEADRIGKKHLFTLQEGVSEGQMVQMESAGIVLVVPQGLHKKYPKEIREKLVSFERFIAEVKSLDA